MTAGKKTAAFERELARADQAARRGKAAQPRVLFAGMWQLDIKTWGRVSGGLTILRGSLAPEGAERPLVQRGHVLPAEPDLAGRRRDPAGQTDEVVAILRVGRVELAARDRARRLRAATGPRSGSPRMRSASSRRARVTWFTCPATSICRPATTASRRRSRSSRRRSRRPPSRPGRATGAYGSAPCRGVRPRRHNNRPGPRARPSPRR